jgi:hypothetical protein
MIRPLTLITAAMFLASGAYMFSVKHNAQVLDQQIAADNQQAALDGQGILVLTAQWSKDNSPDRLQQFASKYTDMSPVQPNQLVTLHDLGGMLPAAGAKAPAQNPVLAAAEDDAPLTGQPPQTDPAVLLADAAPPVDAQADEVFKATGGPVTVAPAASVTAHRTDVVPPVRLAATVATAPRPAASSPASAPAVRVADAITASVRHKKLRTLKHQPDSELAMVTSHAHPFEVPASPQIVAARAITPVAYSPAPLGGGSMLGMAQNMGTGGVN